MKILVVEDDREIAGIIKDGLEADGNTIELAEDGSVGSFLARSYEYDAIVLDYSLPKKNGLDLCREIRVNRKSVPIIFLSVNGDTETKIAALELGADDYMTKPFALAELKARLKAVTRRPTNIKKTSIIQVDDLIFDPDKHKIERSGAHERSRSHD